jgi:3-phenylpropionate/cinnamic acid dioxygenase small subunit
MEVPLVTLPAHVQVANLVARYAEAMDLGDFDAVAGLFAGGVVTSEGSDRSFSGRDEVLRLLTAWTRRYSDDGTPHTKHLTTNLILDIDDEAGTASARSCYCVLQAVSPDFPLQPIITGRYHDTFVRDGQNWHFASRHIFTDQIGSLGHHLLIDLDP